MPTRARIATVCQASHWVDAGSNIAFVADRLDAAIRTKPDLVCLPESFAAVGPSAAAAETVPGPSTDMAAKRARKARCYVIVPVIRSVDGRALNSAVVLDRSGSVAGIYDKVHPVASIHDYTLFEDGMRPGSGFPVFDLDFGRIGIQICFDVGFPEGWQQLADQGARLVFWPSAYHGGSPLQVWAAVHGYYVVTSVRTDRSRIIDPCGTVLAQTDANNNVAWWDINLDFAICHYDFNYSVPDRISAAYPTRVTIRSHRDDGRFLVEPTDPAITVEQLAREFGFEPIRQYHDRHRPAYARLLEGKAPEPQKARHGERPMYSAE